MIDAKQVEELLRARKTPQSWQARCAKRECFIGWMTLGEVPVAIGARLAQDCLANPTEGYPPNGVMGDVDVSGWRSVDIALCNVFILGGTPVIATYVLAMMPRSRGHMLVLLPEGRSPRSAISRLPTPSRALSPSWCAGGQHESGAHHT